MAFRHILFDISDEIATITLNRPDARNAFSSEMGEDLDEALDIIKEKAGTEVKAVSVDFRSSDTAVARVQAVDGVGGTYAHQVRYVVARKAGTTQVVASYEGGVDTAQVRVLAPESSAPR